MKVKKQRKYSAYTHEAIRLLGMHIQQARKLRNLSETNMADRAGIARKTLQKIEKGDPRVAIGFSFELAALLGIRLFDAEPSRMALDLDRMEAKLAILPKRIRNPKSDHEVKDDF